jgi:hypothetical protein
MTYHFGGYLKITNCQQNKKFEIFRLPNERWRIGGGEMINKKLKARKILIATKN